MKVKDWLPPMLRTWAAQKKRVMTGKRIFQPLAADGEPHVHYDGWARTSATIAGSEGGATGGGNGVTQHYAEVYEGDGLLIWRALHGAPYEVWESIEQHYLAEGRAPEKAQRMGISLAAYWARLDRSYYYLAGRLETVKMPERVDSGV